MMENINVLCSIAARAGSKGVPGKNSKLLNGEPLISYSIRTALESKYVSKVVVNTEDLTISQIAKEHGADVPFVRGVKLSHDNTTLTEVTQNTLFEMAKLGHQYDAILQLSPTCPFISSISLDSAIQLMIENDCDSVVSVKKIEHDHPYRAKEIDDNGIVSPFIKDIDVEAFKQRQDLPLLYSTSGGIYLRKSHLFDNWNGDGFCLGSETHALILDDVQSINIDRLIDFEFSEFIMKSIV